MMPQNNKQSIIIKISVETSPRLFTVDVKLDQPFTVTISDSFSLGTVLINAVISSMLKLKFRHKKSLDRDGQSSKDKDNLESQ